MSRNMKEGQKQLDFTISAKLLIKYKYTISNLYSNRGFLEWHNWDIMMHNIIQKQEKEQDIIATVLASLGWQSELRWEVTK